MADLRIADAPVLSQESITDDVKMPTGGLGNFSVRLGDILWYVITKEQLANKSYVDLSSKGVQDKLDTHIADKANPHSVTKAQVGLGNVDNTADVDKPVSNAVNSAIITATNDMATKTYVNQKDNLKADVATTLSGYGINDAYTKDEVNNALSLKADASYVDGKDGDLTALKTADKTNLVKAINEIHGDTKGVVALYDKNVAAGAGANGWTDQLIALPNGRTQRDKNSECISIKDYGAIGDGTLHTLQEWVDSGKFSNLTAIQFVYPHATALTDSIDWVACQAAIDFVGKGGTVLFNQTEQNTYVTDRPLKYFSGQKWVGCGGIDVLGLGTEIKLITNATSVAEPKNPGKTTYGFNPIGIYFNAQGFAGVGLSLYNASYSNVDQCAANSTKENGCGFLFDSDTSKQCYFNKLNIPRAFASGAGGSAFRFVRGANANQIWGGKAGGSYRGAEFLSLSSGNMIVATDFEENTDCHVYVDVSNNCFIGLHMEVSPIGYNITANGWGTRRICTTFASTVTIPVQDASKSAATLDYQQNGTGELQYNIFKSTVTSLSTSAAQNNDLNLTSGAENILFNWFRNTNSSSVTKRITFYKADGTATEAFRFDLATSEIQCGDITQKSSTGIQCKMIRAAAIPTAGAWSNGDKVLRTNPNTTNSVVTEWTCVTAGTPGKWAATGWYIKKDTTANRPTGLTSSDVGVQFFDTTLAAAGKPIWWTGSAWVDATGLVV